MTSAIEVAVQGVKPVRFRSLPVKATGTPFAVVTASTPESGYVWSVLSLRGSIATAGNASTNWYRTSDPSVFGPGVNLTNETLPNFFDRVQNASANTDFIYTKGELILNTGEYIVGVFFGAGVTNAWISITGEAIEVPAEMVGKLLL